MSEKLLYEIEMAFLKQIYEHKGAIGVNELLHIFQSSYGLKEDIFNRILGVVMQQEYCIIEKIRKLDNTEEEVIFVTYKGLEKFLEKKKFSVKNLLKNKIAYELKCEGYKTYSDWLGAMSIFGSYIGKEQSLFGESIRVCILDTFVAIFAGLIIFPACSAFGVNADSGPSLIFVTLPNIFSNMTGGQIWGSLFFLFMSVAVF